MSLGSASRNGSRQLTSVCSQARRAYTTTPQHLAEAQVQKQPPAASKQSTTKAGDNAGAVNNGSGKRKIGFGSAQKLPFHLHPYQCFQEARKVLATDREEKLKRIEAQRERITEAEERKADSPEAENNKRMTLMALRRHLHWLKIQADINDPVIKKRFEDKEGDMNKPIYRYLADQKWRSYDRKIIMQRLTTMHIIPDIFPALEPRVAVSLSFRQRNIPPGDFVPSIISSETPSLNIQAYDKGPRYYTVGVFDPDVPDLASDSFTNRCHFLATNILVSPTSPAAPLHKLAADQIVIDWLPPHAQKGSPYHRLCTFVYEQPGRVDPLMRSEKTETEEQVRGRLVDAAKMKEQLAGNGRNVTAPQIAGKFRMRPVGAHMFRTVWDDWMAATMERHGLQGADIELKRRSGEKLPPKKRETGRYRGNRT